MGARRAAGDGEKIGVATVVGDILADPRDRPLHVHEVGRKRAARALAVVDRDADPAEFDHVAHQRVALHSLVADRPRAAGDLDQNRCPGPGRQVMAAPDVEQVVAPARAVGDV